MLFFLDTEYTGYGDNELISLGLVSEDGKHILYLEVEDFDCTHCNNFVRSMVLPNLRSPDHTQIKKKYLPEILRNWFATLPRSVVIACDSPIDRQLLDKVFESRWPENVVGWFDLRPLIDTGVFDKAVCQYHSTDRPWHHALHDAQAHRAGWMKWMRCRRKVS